VVQINSTAAQIERANKVRDRLMAAGMNVTVLPTEFEDRASRYPPGTVNLVFKSGEVEQATRVRQIVDAANVTRDIANFVTVNELTYAPIQLNLW
jgi:hypothetical protein